MNVYTVYSSCRQLIHAMIHRSISDHLVFSRQEPPRSHSAHKAPASTFGVLLQFSKVWKVVHHPHASCNFEAQGQPLVYTWT